MNIKLSIKKGFLLASILLVQNNIFSQEKTKEEQTVAPVQDFKIKEVLSQKPSSGNGIDDGTGTVSNTNHYRTASSAGDGTDIGISSNSAFQLGTDISGTIQNSINQVTGKLAFSVPLASVASGNVSYSLNIGYDGQSAFKIGKELNKYSPVSVVGVGWSLPIPKIVVNNKQTTAIDDDDFYLIDGATNSTLICTKKTGSIYTYQLEKHANWQITYSKSEDHWTVIKDDGTIYSFGQNGDSNSKEVLSSWGNWIGNSNQNPTGTSTIVWNLSKISDQWNNYIDFKYEKVENGQNSSQVLYKHTEASYIKEIVSSKGARIKLNYGFKSVGEYVEPHLEAANEPDAYQERYEKKYLQNVEVYNNTNEKIMSYNLTSTWYWLGTSDKKRYLTAITQTSYVEGQEYSLPAQEFEYHTSGTFKGGLKKVVYPSGGSVTYNYENKYLFSNGTNRFVVTPSSSPDYIFYSVVVKDNYCLYVRRTANPASNGKHTFKFFRYWWNGQQWESNEFTFPHLIEDDYPGNVRLKDFYAILEDDFYGFAYDKGTTADVYLFHKNNDGKTWNYYTQTDVNIGNEDPRFISGKGFVALGSHRSGNLYTYVWNESTWNYKQISQGSGQYYYAANNNFILSLDEDGGSDMITSVSHQDNYYIHYLDAEKKWQTKSWSAFADPYISGIENPSYFYPGNSIAGFVADNNPEFFLRWDSDYNLIAVDSGLGSYYDGHPIEVVGNDMFTIRNDFYGAPYKTARFNGLGWDFGTLPSSSSYYAKLNFGEDMMTFQNHDNISGVGYYMYDPNQNSFFYGSINSTGLFVNLKGNGITSEFVIAGDKIYRRSLQGPPTLLFQHIGSLQYSNYFTHTDGLSHAFVKEALLSGSAINFQKGTFLYIDKESGALGSINLGKKDHLRGSQKLGGNTTFMSTQTLWVKEDTSSDTVATYLYRIIDDKFNQSVYDIVVGSIDLDDDNGNVRKINYTYNNPNSLPDNNITYYGEVIVENKGFGSGSIGKVKKIFNNGLQDVQMIGLQLEEQILDVNNLVVKKTTNNWSKYSRTISNGSFQVGVSYNIVLQSKREELVMNSGSIINLTSYSYNSLGQIVAVQSNNSKGKLERQEIRYAYEEYSFINDKNMLSDTYEITTKLDNTVVDVKRNVFVNDSGKVYVKEKWSGPNLSQLRMNSEITYIDSAGNLLETSDVKNIYSSVLNGYSNMYEVATIVNARHEDVVSQLDVTYSQLQNLNTTNLKIELMKLYGRLPNAMISLAFYDNNGRVVNQVNERGEQSFIYYDPYGRVDYITDGYGNIIEKKEYNFGN